MSEPIEIQSRQGGKTAKMIAAMAAERDAAIAQANVANEAVALWRSTADQYKDGMYEYYDRALKAEAEVAWLKREVSPLVEAVLNDEAVASYGNGRPSPMTFGMAQAAHAALNKERTES